MFGPGAVVLGYFLHANVLATQTILHHLALCQDIERLYFPYFLTNFFLHFVNCEQVLSNFYAELNNKRTNSIILLKSKLKAFLSLNNFKD